MESWPIHDQLLVQSLVANFVFKVPGAATNNIIP
jgi:hypothetical protein